MSTSTVEWFDSAKGCGFIQPDDGIATSSSMPRSWRRPGRSSSASSVTTRALRAQYGLRSRASAAPPHAAGRSHRLAPFPSRGRSGRAQAHEEHVARAAEHGDGAAARRTSRMTILRDGAVVPLPCRRSVACRLTGGDWHRADDLVPDTMVDALHARYQVTLGTSRKAWLLASLRNRFHSVVGRQPAKAEVHGAKLGPLRSTPAAQAVGTVTSRAHRARERLRRMRLDEAASLGEPAVRRRAVAADPIVATHAGGRP